MRTTDLSFGGAGLCHDDALPPVGATGVLAVACYHNGHFYTLSVSARVRYTRHSQMALHSGLEFLRLSSAELAALQSMVSARPLLLDSSD